MAAQVATVERSDIAEWPAVLGDLCAALDSGNNVAAAQALAQLGLLEAEDPGPGPYQILLEECMWECQCAGTVMAECRIRAEYAPRLRAARAAEREPDRPATAEILDILWCHSRIWVIDSTGAEIDSAATIDRAVLITREPELFAAGVRR